MVTLRDYQIRTLDAVWDAMQRKSRVLMEAPCGAGKTVCFSKLIQRLQNENPAFRSLILVDREVLVTQAADKLIMVAPELAGHIGIICASVQAKKELDRPVTIASRQTLEKYLGQFQPVQMCICDEAHLIPIPHFERKPGQYERILNTLLSYNERMRLIGCTASPYRLGPYGGYIFGDQNRTGSSPYWPELDARITTAELTEQGFLVPIRAFVRVGDNMSRDLGQVSLVAGEYNLGQLGQVMCRKEHVNSCVDACMEYAKERKKVLVFCTNKEHADAVAKAFLAASVPACAIYSGMPPAILEANMQALENGTQRVFCSVAMLTTGLDVPDVDCIILARPTRSTALFKQIIGRSQRVAPGKTDALVIDLVGSFAEFGFDPDNFKVKVPILSGPGPAVEKICPNDEEDVNGKSGCGRKINASLYFCPHCGFQFPQKEVMDASMGEMREISVGKEPPPEPMELEVYGVWYEPHKSKNSGKELIRVTYDCGAYYGRISEYLCLPDSYSGFAVDKARAWWAKRSIEPFPEKVDEFLFLADSLVKPASITVVKDGRYDRVLGFNLAEPEMTGDAPQFGDGETYGPLPAHGKYNPDEVPF